VGWFSHSIRKYLTEGQFESFEGRLDRIRKAGGPAYGTIAERAEQLEEDLARAVLIIHTLTEACVRKGLFTREEVAQVASEIDLLDGVADGQLNPAVVRPTPPEPPQPPSETRWQ
jgi:hypothetical protein